MLKNSLLEIVFKKHLARMPYKRFSLSAYTFPVTHFELVFRKIDFFNTHEIYRQVSPHATISRVTKERWAQIGITSEFLIVVRTLGEFFR
jgi:hypothetical protein